MNRGPMARMAQGPAGRRPGGPNAALTNMEKASDTKGTLLKLIKYIGKSKYLVLVLLAFTVVTTLLNLAEPLLQAEAIDAITVKEGSLSVNFAYLYRVLIIMLIVYASNSAISYLSGIMSARLSQKTVYTMRKELFSKMGKLPIKFFDTHSHGDLMSRMTSDVENVSNTISQSISSLFSSVITVLGAFVIMLSKDWRLTLVSLITIPMSMFVTLKLSKFMRKYFREQSRTLGALNGHVEEMITGYKTVIAFGREESAVREFYENSSKLKRIGIKAAIFGGVMGPLMNVIGNFGYLVIATVGGYLAFRDPTAMSIGTIQAFLILSKKFTRPINELANQYAQIQTAIAGAERVFEIMDSAPETDEGICDFDENCMTGNIEIKNVDFSYVEGQRVLSDFNLSVRAGSKIALVGKTGSGKTTVANLITRFYDVDSGEILIDGINIKDIKKSELRRNIAIVLQDTVLFSDTVKNNILYGKLDATDEQVENAAKTANAHNFILQLQNGYETQLSESGGNLSQGQRQLLSIARAVLADPKILILDEATSSVDTRTEMNIQNAMVRLMKNRTSLIIAHRLSTIKDADMIVVIDAGTVAECGTHEELIKKGGAYYELYKTQYEGFKT